MPYANLSIGIDENLRQTLLNFLSDMELNMSFLVQLTPAEKKKYLRLGAKSPAFLSRAVELAKQNPQVLPNYFNQAEFEKDVQDFEIMSDLLVQINKLQQAIKDTKMAFEQESIRAALDFYKHCQSAANQNVAGSQEVVKELSSIMPKKGKFNKKKLL
jgi:hypothetical protein